MINENANSRKVKIKMKDNVLSKSTPQDIFQTLNVDASSAEWYPIYTTIEVDDETVTEIGYSLCYCSSLLGIVHERRQKRLIKKNQPALYDHVSINAN